MKTKALLFAIAILISGLSFAQNSATKVTSKCEKKVLRKIQNKMLYVDMSKHLDEGEKVKLILTCKINDNNIVELVNIRGGNEELKKEIGSILQEYPVSCKSNSSNPYFSFALTFDMHPGKAVL